MLIHNKDDIEFVTEFPSLLGHPVLRLVSVDIKFNSISAYTPLHFSRTLPLRYTYKSGRFITVLGIHAL